METASTPPVEAVTSDTKSRTKHNSTSRQIRGSSLMLVGRTISMVANFAIQVLIVRYLSKANYGAFAYAMSFVTLGQTIATFGLDRAITRFVPIYHERRDYNKMFGTILLVIGTIVSLGTLMVLSAYAFQDVIGQTLLNEKEGDKAQVIALLLILIGLAPVQALDDLIAAMFAIFASPRAIFFRKYILSPGLKLSVVLLLMLFGSDEFFLASGYLAAGILGTTVYGFTLFRTLQKQQLFKELHFKSLTVPARELFAFTIPLLTSDLVYVLMSSSDAVLLGHFKSTSDVAAFRAILPSAVLNQFVLQSFTILFTPIASRLFARDDYEGINNLYWQTAVWTSVLSFPIFALTFSMANPLTVILYGQKYASSAVLLALLSFGYYFNAALGFNGLTLKVYGRLRYIVIINILAAIINIAINLLLIPQYGALGAACGTCGTMVIHNLLKQAGLRFGTGIRLFDWKYVKVYASIIIAALGLLAFQWVLPQNYSWKQPYIYISFAVTGAVALAVVALNRKSLNIEQTFPELLRIPLMRKFFT
ncbi:MAG: flippase [Chloroflexi bacterium SZAS-1]|jgi:O-antigen/teichoic acid export membrane protein|nr:flippase [Chloroflexi bacterium SZAS-1]